MDKCDTCKHRPTMSYHSSPCNSCFSGSLYCKSRGVMYTEEMEKIERAIQALKGLIEDYEERWEQHAHGCDYYEPNPDGDGGCSNNDPDYDPVCQPGNCPLLK